VRLKCKARRYPISFTPCTESESWVSRSLDGCQPYARERLANGWQPCIRESSNFPPATIHHWAESAALARLQGLSKAICDPAAQGPEDAGHGIQPGLQAWVVVVNDQGAALACCDVKVGVLGEKAVERVKVPWFDRDADAPLSVQVVHDDRAAHRKREILLREEP
jgi:hypothetical protein